MFSFYEKLTYCVNLHALNAPDNVADFSSYFKKQAARHSSVIVVGGVFIIQLARIAMKTGWMMDFIA